MSQPSCGQNWVHDPHPFTTTQGSYPPVEREAQCPGKTEDEEKK